MMDALSVPNKSTRRRKDLVDSRKEIIIMAVVEIVEVGRSSIQILIRTRCMVAGSFASLITLERVVKVARLMDQFILLVLNADGTMEIRNIPLNIILPRRMKILHYQARIPQF